MRGSGSIDREVYINRETRYGTETNTGDKIHVDVNYDTRWNKVEKEYYEDSLDALEEAFWLLRYLLCNGTDFDSVKEDFQIQKIMNTFEHYDKVRKEYE